MESPRFFQFPRVHPADGESGRVPVRYSFGLFALDVDRHVLTRSGEPIALPPKGFDLLCLFLRSNGDVLEKDRIMRALWPETFVEEANLSNLIALLRRALGDSPARSNYIHTVPKVGYRFVASVNTSQGKPAPATDGGERNASAIRIIVFPFRLSGALNGQEHLAYSLPESVSTSLAELNAFTVRSMQLAVSFDPLRWDPRAVGKEAEVEFILTGMMGPSRAGISVSTQLIAAQDGTVAWSQQWEIAEEEIASVHHAVIHHVVRRLARDAVDTNPGAALAGMPADPEASRMYLLANQLTTRRDLDNFALARDLYVACLERDPMFAPAWARLGRCYRWFEKFGPAEISSGGKAKMAFERAFAINPDLVLAHNLYTPIESDAGQAESAMARLLRRLHSHRNSAELFAGLVHACRYCGQLEASLAAHRRAVELDSRIRTSVAHTWFALGDYERAMFWYGSREGVYLDVLILASSGRERECAAILSTRKARFGMMPDAMNSLEAYVQGDRARGVEVLRAAAAKEEPEPEALFYLARQAARFEELDLANQLLAQSIAGGYWTTAALRRDAWLDPLRATSRFRELLAMADELEARSRCAFLASGGEQILVTAEQRESKEGGRLA